MAEGYHGLLAFWVGGAGNLGEVTTSKTASDTLSLGVTEATSDLLALLNRSDTLGLSLAEQGTLLALLTVADTASVGIGEGHSLLVLYSVSDSLALGIAETAASNLLVSVQVSEALVIGVGDSASILVTVVKAVTDTLGLSLSEVTAAQILAYARKVCRWWMNHIPFVIEK